MSSKGLCRTIFLSAFLSLASAGYGDTNILVNPGFESGTDGWADRSCQIEAVARSCTQRVGQRKSNRQNAKPGRG